MHTSKLLRVVLFSLSLAAALCWGPAAHGGGAVGAEVRHDDGQEIVLEFRFGAYRSTGVDMEGLSYEQIVLPGEGTTLEAGAPALPVVARSVIVPDGARLALDVLEADYHDVAARVAPSKGDLLRSVDPATVPYTFGPVYGHSAFYPPAAAVLDRPHVLRDWRGVTVRVHPLQYDPVAGTLRVYSRLLLRVRASGPGGENPLDRSLGTAHPSRAFDDVYRAHFLNWNQGGHAPLAFDEQGEMLIITHDAWIPNLGPFVAHKTWAGIPVTVVGVSTIGNNPTAIKNYVKSFYTAHDLSYLLLVGDIAQVASPDVLGGASDPSYSKLAGNDNYPEIIVGRFSANTAAQLDTQVQRTIAYETLPATEQEWFWKGTGIASAEGAGIGDEGQSDQQHESEIRGWLLGAGYTEVDQIYDPGATTGQISAALNGGRGVVNYTGHGSATGWGTTGFSNGNVDALTNVGKLPFILSVACNNGEFETYDTCFAEAWMRATEGGAPAGAIGIYASSISQYWAEPMEAQDEFNILLTDSAQPFVGFGALCFAGSISMIDVYGQAGADMFDTWILFGDPSLRVRGTVVPPHGLAVQPGTGAVVHGPPGGPFPGGASYTLTNIGEQPLDWVAISAQPWLVPVPGAGTLPGKATVVVTLQTAEGARNLDTGRYAGAVAFVNLTDHEGDTSRDVALTVGIPQLKYAWTLDADPGWSSGDGRWAYGVPGGAGGGPVGYPDPAYACTGDKVFGVNLSGNYPIVVGGPYYLTAQGIDLTGVIGAELRYERWLNTVGPPAVSSSVEVSVDAAAWATAWSAVAEVCDAGWATQQHDISAADGSPSAAIRWGYQIHNAGSVPCSGWNLDDVQIWAVPDVSARIHVSVDRSGLGWTPGAGATSYDVVSGDLEALRSTGGDFSVATEACLADNWNALTLSLAADPGPGQGRWFLVRGVGPAGPLTYQALYDTQQGVRDEEIAASPLACP